MPDGSLITELYIDAGLLFSGCATIHPGRRRHRKIVFGRRKSVDNLGQSIDVSTTKITTSAAQTGLKTLRWPLNPLQQAAPRRRR